MGCRPNFVSIACAFANNTSKVSSVRLCYMLVLAWSTAPHMPEMVCSLHCNEVFRHSKSPVRSSAITRPSRVFPFRNVPWRPLALAEVSAKLHDTISSRAVSLDSYCLRTERMAWVRTVHLVGQRGFKWVNLHHALIL